VFYTGPSPKLPHFDHRQQLQFGHKKAIAGVAASLIEDGDTLLLDGGSTTYELASLLIGRPLQVVTNSLPVATLFTSSDGSDLVLIGGYVHGRTGVSVGPYANLMLAELNVQRAIISVAGITERGVFNSNLLLVETERAMCQSADSVMVVADSTKFGRSSLALMCELEQLDDIVIDDGIEPEWVKRLETAGVRVHLAETENVTAE
jgi:DeoR/GlpR family transcriptional regulator of sugar metabolism